MWLVQQRKKNSRNSNDLNVIQNSEFHINDICINLVLQHQHEDFPIAWNGFLSTNFQLRKKKQYVKICWKKCHRTW